MKLFARTSICESLSSDLSQNTSFFCGVSGTNQLEPYVSIKNQYNVPGERSRTYFIHNYRCIRRQRGSRRWARATELDNLVLGRCRHGLGEVLQRVFRAGGWRRPRCQRIHGGGRVLEGSTEATVGKHGRENRTAESPFMLSGMICRAPKSDWCNIVITVKKRQTHIRILSG